LGESSVIVALDGVNGMGDLREQREDHPPRIRRAPSEGKPFAAAATSRHSTVTGVSRRMSGEPLPYAGNNLDSAAPQAGGGDEGIASHTESATHAGTSHMLSAHPARAF
jgi:hypothetical protein